MLQDLGFLAFMLDQVEVIRPTSKPRGLALTRAQKMANRRMARRRVRVANIEGSLEQISCVPVLRALRR
jgi:hypothetical protein